MTDALTPHGRVLLALADALAELALDYCKLMDTAEPALFRDRCVEITAEPEVFTAIAERIADAARIAGSLSTELLSVQTGRE